MLLRTSIISGVSFFLGVIVTMLILTPDYQSLVINKRAEVFNKLHLIIVILSAPGNAESRDAIRKTWISLKSPQTLHIFVIGTKNLSTNLQISILEEKMFLAYFMI